MFSLVASLGWGVFSGGMGGLGHGDFAQDELQDVGTRAQVHDGMNHLDGAVYRRDNRSATQLENAFALAIEAGHDQDAFVLSIKLAEHAREQGDLAGAEYWVGHASALAHRGQGDRARARVLLVRARLQLARERFDAARADATTVIELLERTSAVPSDLVEPLVVLGSSLIRMGRHLEARRSLERAVDLIAVEPSIDTQLEAEAKDQLSIVLGWLGEFDLAAPLVLDALRLVEERYGHEHPALLPVLYDLGGNQVGRAEFEAAFDTYARGVEIAIRAFGAAHPETARFYMLLGYAHVEAGFPDDALTFLQQSIHTYDLAGWSSAVVGVSYQHVGDAEADRGQFEAAKAAYEKALDRFSLAFETHQYYIAQTKLRLGLVLIELGELDAATRLIDSGYAESMPDLRAFERGWANRAMARRYSLNSATSARARAYGELAYAAFVEAGPVAARRAASERAWLDEQASDVERRE